MKNTKMRIHKLLTLMKALLTTKTEEEKALIGRFMSMNFPRKVVNDVMGNISL